MSGKQYENVLCVEQKKNLISSTCKNNCTLVKLISFLPLPMLLCLPKMTVVNYTGFNNRNTISYVFSCLVFYPFIPISIHMLECPCISSIFYNNEQ